MWICSMLFLCTDTREGTGLCKLPARRRKIFSVFKASRGTFGWLLSRRRMVEGTYGFVKDERFLCFRISIPSPCRPWEPNRPVLIPIFPFSVRCIGKLTFRARTGDVQRVLKKSAGEIGFLCSPLISHKLELFRSLDKTARRAICLIRAREDW